MVSRLRHMHLWLGLRGDEDRSYRHDMARFVEIREVKRVVPGLIESVRRVLTGSNFKLEHEQHVVERQHCVDPLTQTRNRVFEVDSASVATVAQSTSQYFDLFLPSDALACLNRKLRSLDQGADNCVWIRVQEFADRCAIRPPTDSSDRCLTKSGVGSQLSSPC